MHPQAIIKQVVNIIQSHLPREYAPVLFGSHARGDALETSDIDIGIIGKRIAPWEEMVEIKQEIENIQTLRSVEVVDLNSVSEKFKKKALSEAMPLT